MEFKDFVGHLAEAIDVDVSELSGETEFQKLPIWDSMSLLTVIAMVDEYYGKVLSGEDVESATTVQDLYNLIVAK